MDNNLDKEIDLIEILKKIYSKKRFISTIVTIFTLIGIISALLSTDMYSSSTIFIPQNQESSTSSLSGVASLVGINLASSNYGGEIPSTMYPQVAESPKFKRLLLSEIIDKKTNKTLKEFIVENYKIKDQDKKSSSNLFVSKLEEKCFEMIDEIISIDVNQKEGFVTITSTSNIADYSAVISNKSKEILQEIIISNKIESAKQNLIFSEKQLSEKKLIFDEIQAKLAYFSDSNLNSVNSFVINEKNKLEAEFEIINAVVTELSKQVEQAKLQVKKDTPVFSTIKKAFIPNERTAPKRFQIVLIFIFLGFTISLIYIFLSDYLKDIFVNEKLKK